MGSTLFKLIILKTLNQIDGIRKSCRIVAKVLKHLEKEIGPGITTMYLNNIAEDLCFQYGGIPGFKGYKGFPFSICASKNHTIAHGFPNNTPLVDGDILSIDFGVVKCGWYGDSAFTVGVGEINDSKSKFLRVGEECLYKGIESIRPLCRIGDISNEIQKHAESNNYFVVREFVGHGIGLNLHEEPQVPNFGVRHSGVMLKPGTVIAIEPMINMGNGDIIIQSNGWTADTSDRSLSVHFEHTIVFDGKDVEILTDRNM